MIAFRAPTHDELVEQAFFGFTHDVTPGYAAKLVGNVVESLPRPPCYLTCLACREHQDDGDEHRDAPIVVVEPDGISALLAEWGDVQSVSSHAMRMIMLAEAHRYCCAACAAEVDGEDGS